MFAGGAEQEKPKFGRTVDQPQQKAGVVPVNMVQDLFAECGCKSESGQPVKVGSLPFQAFATVDKERWCLRVEAPGFHDLDGESVFGAAWSFSLAGSEQHPNR